MQKTNFHAGKALQDLRDDERRRFAELAEDIEAGKFKTHQQPVTDSADAEESRRRVLAATLHAVTSGPLGNPNRAPNALPDSSDPASYANGGGGDMAGDLFKLDIELDARIENFYTGPGRKFLPLHFLYGADGDGKNSIRAIVARAVRNYHAHFFYGDGATVSDVVVVATSRPEQSWVIAGGARTIEVVTELIEGDVHCDFDFFADTDYGSCVDRLGHVADLFGKLDADPYVGKPSTQEEKRKYVPERQRYITEHFSTVPFRCGNLYILSRICHGCYATFLKQNNVDTDKVEIVEPWSDGFGSIRAKAT